MELECQDGWYVISPLFIEAVTPAYPSLNVTRELQKAALWTLANPRKRKRVSGAERFLIGWLNRATQQTPAPTLFTSEPECPHDPPCSAPGRWACVRKTQRAQMGA